MYEVIKYEIPIKPTEFRTSRFCVEQTNTLVAHIERYEINEKKNKVAFIDISLAYNMVRRKGLGS